AFGDQLYGVDLEGDLAVVVGFGTTLATVDLSTATRPALLGAVRGGPGFDVALRGSRAFVAAGEAGVLALDVSNPASPRIAAYYDTSGTAIEVAVDDGTVHVATVDGQHWALACDACVAGCQASADVQPPSVAACE